MTLAGVYTAPHRHESDRGCSYGWIGDATTAIGGAQGIFTDNHYVGVGVKVGWSF